MAGIEVTPVLQRELLASRDESPDGRWPLRQIVPQPIRRLDAFMVFEVAVRDAPHASLALAVVGAVGRVIPPQVHLRAHHVVVVCGKVDRRVWEGVAEPVEEADRQAFQIVEVEHVDGAELRTKLVRYVVETVIAQVDVRGEEALERGRDDRGVNDVRGCVGLGFADAHRHLVRVRRVGRAGTEHDDVRAPPSKFLDGGTQVEADATGTGHLVVGLDEIILKYPQSIGLSSAFVFVAITRARG